MTQLKEGQPAPPIDKTASNGKTIRLEDLQGQKIILYFYPKDNTPGCTAEACNLRDNHSRLQEEGFKVIGISPDSDASHEKFSARHTLPFPLIADPDKEIMQAYGVWGEKKMFGKTYMGVKRTTFVIDEKGIIEKIFKQVKTKDHAAQIFESLDT